MKNTIEDSRVKLCFNLDDINIDDVEAELCHRFSKYYIKKLK